MDLYRISNHVDLKGLGGLRAAGRWHTIGKRVVYLAASPAGALVEILVHLDLPEDDRPLYYTLLHIAAPDALTISTLRIPSGDDWKSNESITRKLGDAWLQSGRSALACVPSSIVPASFNYLLNPLHPDFAQIKIKSAEKVLLDPRLKSPHPSTP